MLTVVGVVKGWDILLSLLLEVQKGFLEDRPLKLQSEVDQVKREGRVCRRGTAHVESCGGREHPMHLVSEALI